MVATKFIVVITSQYIHVSNYFCTPESNIKLMQNISQYKPSPKRKWEDLTNLAVLSTQSELTKSVEVKSLSHVWLLATPWTVAHQAPLSKGFSRQESWSGLPFPSPGDLPNPGIKPRSPTLQADSLLAEPSGKPRELRPDQWLYWHPLHRKNGVLTTGQPSPKVALLNCNYLIS